VAAFSLNEFYQRNRRIVIWVILFGLLWLLRDFFGVVLLSFVLAIIAVPLADIGTRRLKMPHWLSLTLVYVLFLLVLGSFVRFVVPSVAGLGVSRRELAAVMSDPRRRAALRWREVPLPLAAVRGLRAFCDAYVPELTAPTGASNPRSRPSVPPSMAARSSSGTPAKRVRISSRLPRKVPSACG